MFCATGSSTAAKAIKFNNVSSCNLILIVWLRYDNWDQFPPQFFLLILIVFATENDPVTARSVISF